MGKVRMLCAAFTLLSLTPGDLKNTASFQDVRERFQSPKFGVGPGEYQTTEELEKAQKEVAW